MSAVAFSCSKCKAALAVEPGTSEINTNCPQCTAPVEAFLFPAFFRSTPSGPAASALVDQSETSCFYHPQKRAVGVCDGCGRLMCSLCSIEFGAEHLCPNCLEAGKKKGKLVALEDTRRRYDSMALTLAGLGFVLFGFSIFLAPAAIFISVRHWNTPGSLLGSSKVRFVIAILLGSLLLLVWCFIFSSIFFGIMSAPKR